VVFNNSLYVKAVLLISVKAASEANGLNYLCALRGINHRIEFKAVLFGSEDDGLASCGRTVIRIES